MRNMTEIPQYMEFGECLARGDLVAAIRCLDECYTIVRSEGDDVACARLIQYKGNLLYQSGDLQAAKRSYQQACEHANSHPIVMMAYARFLGTVGEYDEAHSLLLQLELLLPNIQPREGEYSLSAYQERIEEIRELIKKSAGVLAYQPSATES